MSRWVEYEEKAVLVPTVVATRGRGPFSLSTLTEDCEWEGVLGGESLRSL